VLFWIDFWWRSSGSTSATGRWELKKENLSTFSSVAGEQHTPSIILSSASRWKLFISAE
jgi:hypothetical protein